MSKKTILVHVSGRRASQRNTACCRCFLKPSTQTRPTSLSQQNAHLFSTRAEECEHHLPVGLGNTLELVLLLDGVRVAAALGGVNQLLSQALSNRLDVAERGLAGTGGQEGNSLVDAAEGRDIDGLSSDGTGRADSGGVLTGTAVDNGIDGDLDGVLVGHQVDLFSNC